MRFRRAKPQVSDLQAIRDEAAAIRAESVRVRCEALALRLDVKAALDDLMGMAAQMKGTE